MNFIKIFIKNVGIFILKILESIFLLGFVSLILIDIMLLFFIK